MMNSDHIAAIIKSMTTVSSTMLDLSVTLGAPALRESPNSEHDVSAIIGLSGDCVGTIALSFPTATALAMVERFTGAPVTADDPDFTDAVGEIANMVTGSAKASFVGYDVSISCPSVIVGPGHRISQQSELPAVEIPVESECGTFVILVAYRTAKANEMRAAS